MDDMKEVIEAMGILKKRIGCDQEIETCSDFPACEGCRFGTTTDEEEKSRRVLLAHLENLYGEVHLDA